MEQQQLSLIKNTIKEFFEKTSFEVEIEFWPMEEETIPVKIKTNEPQMLIGEGGQTLADIQHILKALLKRKVDENFYISLDVNDYQKRKSEHLRETAKSLADEVALTKKERELPSMPAYERRIVHMELSQREDIETESTGEEPNRRIIIKPKS